MTNVSPIEPTAPPADEFQYRQALEAVRPEMEALTEEQLAPMNLDIPTCVMTVRGAMAEIMPFKDRVAAALPKFNLALFDKLETYAMALGYANTRHRVASTPVMPLEELQEAAVALREQLLSDLQPLAFRGFIDESRLSQVKRVNGYNNLAQEVMLMTELARKSWSVISTKTSLTLAELAHAEQVAERLVKAAGEKEQIKPVVTAENDVRRRAYTLLLNAYDEVRRAITFVRWAEDDIDEIAPSLWSNRVRRKTDKAVAAPVAPAPAPVPQPAPSAAPAPAVSSGMPGEDPLMRG